MIELVIEYGYMITLFTNIFTQTQVNIYFHNAFQITFLRAHNL